MSHFTRFSVGLALCLLPFTSLTAKVSALPIYSTFEDTPWVQNSFQGFSISTPIPLKKMDFAIPEEQKALFHTMEAHMADGGSFMLYGMFMHMKTANGNAAGSLQGAITNAVTQLGGTDFKLEIVEQNNQKTAFLASGTFSRGTDKMMVKGYAHTDLKGKVHVFSAIGADDLRTTNAFTRMLTSITVQ